MIHESNVPFPENNINKNATIAAIFGLKKAADGPFYQNRRLPSDL